MKSKRCLLILLLFFVKNLIAGTVTIQYNGNILDDARITSAAPGFNGGGDGWGNVTYFTSNDNVHRTYFRIPIPSFITPQYADSITHAALKLYFSGLQSGPFDISIHEVTDNWGEFSITWSNRPDHDPVAIDTITLVQEDIWIDFTLTELLKEWVRGEIPNHGMVVKPLIEAPPVQDLSVLWSSDYTDPSLRPILEITSPQLPDTFINSLLTSTDDSRNQSNPSLTFNLYQNYPNPFNPTTIIPFHISKPSVVVLEIYNMLGQKIKTLVNGYQLIGLKSVVWDGRDDKGNEVSSGIYLCKMQAEGFISFKKILLIN